MNSKLGCIFQQPICLSSVCHFSNGWQESIFPTVDAAQTVSEINYKYKILEIFEGNLEVKFPTISIDGKVQSGRNSDMKKIRREKIRDGESQKREDACV